MTGLQCGEREYVIALVSIGQISPGAKQGQKAAVVTRKSLQIPRLRGAIVGVGLQAGKCGLQRFAGRPGAMLQGPARHPRIDHKEQKSDCDRALKHSSPERPFRWAARFVGRSFYIGKLKEIAGIEGQNLTTEARRHGEDWGLESPRGNRDPSLTLGTKHQG